MSALKSINGCKTMMVILLTALAGTLSADVGKANQAFLAATEAYRQQNYVRAADRFMAARLYADDASMRVEAIKGAKKSYRAAGLREKEFECIETLINSFPGLIDYSTMVDRQYEIANDFFQGHRDPEFWSLRWIPWLTGGDHSLKIYETALRHAPFSRYAPEAKLRVARIMIDQGKNEEALKHLRELIRDYPASEARKYAQLELICALMHLARFGDGDGAYNREVYGLMEEFLRHYPDEKESAWVRKRMLEAKDIDAQRLYELARYYNRIGRSRPAERYLGRVLREYPDSLLADKSEKLLSNIDETFAPLRFRPALENRFQSYQETTLPAEGEAIIVAPENSQGRWLLPIRDLGMGADHIRIKRAKSGAGEKND